MKLINYFIKQGVGLFIFLTTLAACVPLTDEQRLERIQHQWEQKNYTPAFKESLLLAKRNNPRAQYLTGYFYYYGQGTFEDPEKAEVWLNRAAQNHDLRAIQALKIIYAYTDPSSCP